MVTFYDDDGEEIKPVSYKDFMTQGKDRMDKWLLNNEATTKEEKEFQAKLKADRAAQLKKHVKEYETLTRQPNKPAVSGDVDSLL